MGKYLIFEHVGVLVNIKMEHQAVNIHYGFFLFGKAEIQYVKSCLVTESPSNMVVFKWYVPVPLAML